MKTSVFVASCNSNLSENAWRMLRHILKERDIDIDELTIEKNPHGKPYIVELPHFHFNISHSVDRIMIIISDKKVGCDVQKMKNINMKIAERFFSQDEYEIIRKCQDERERKETFFRYWTLKESYIKEKGEGLHMPLSSFSVNLDGPKIDNDQSVQLYEFDVEIGYKYACCVEGNERESIDIFIQKP